MLGCWVVFTQVCMGLGRKTLGKSWVGFTQVWVEKYYENAGSFLLSFV